MMMTAERVAIVTGASRGIGAAITRRLAHEGYAVFMVARDETRLAAVASELSASGVTVGWQSADVGDAAAVREVYRTFDARFGRLDVLVNNAGVGIFAPVTELAPEDFDRVMKTNLYGAFHMIREALPRMKAKGGGYIINLGSLAGVNTFRGGAAYCASKFALRALSEIVMRENREAAIRVTTIAPGSVDTGFAGQDPGQRWKIQPATIAQTVIELLSTSPETLTSYVEMRPLNPPRSR